LQAFDGFEYDPPARFFRGNGATMQSLGVLLSSVIQIYIWVLIGSAVLSWLLAFNVLNARNQVVYTIADFLYRITEPALRPIRRFMPNIGGIDISPVVLILLLIFAQNLIYEYWL
jgi:YggT family protein